jgi:hypothetical protein
MTLVAPPSNALLRSNPRTLTGRYEPRAKGYPCAVDDPFLRPCDLALSTRQRPLEAFPTWLSES